MRRRFFQLRDDLQIPNRWHIGRVSAFDGSEITLSSGVRSEYPKSASAEITQFGQELDFTFTSFYVPIVRMTLASQMAKIAKTDLQCIPIQISQMPGFAVLNATRAIDCLDESRSKFIKWTRDDHRSDLAGEYRQVTRLCLNQFSIPQDAHLFRVSRWLIALIVSEPMKRMMEDNGCLGAKFQEV